MGCSCPAPTITMSSLMRSTSDLSNSVATAPSSIGRISTLIQRVRSGHEEEEY